MKRITLVYAGAVAIVLIVALSFFMTRPTPPDDVSQAVKSGKLSTEYGPFKLKTSSAMLRTEEDTALYANYSNICNLPSKKVASHELDEIDSSGDARVYVGPLISFYTDYDAEDIMCVVEEYYDDVLYETSRKSMQLARCGDDIYDWYSVFALNTWFEENDKPSIAEYSVTCTGAVSGNSASITLRLHLTYK